MKIDPSRQINGLIKTGSASVSLDAASVLTVQSPGTANLVRFSSTVGAVQRFEIENGVAASAGNVQGFGFFLQSDAQARAAALLDCDFTNISDAARVGRLRIRTVKAGSFLDTLILTNDLVTISTALAMTGKISTYNNIAVEGYGVPAIVDDVSLTDQGANIGSTNFTNAGVAGTYRVSYYLLTTTTVGGGPDVALTVAWNDGVAARSVVSANVSLAGTNFTSGIFPVKLGSGSISYSVTAASPYSTGRYGLYITLERLS